MAARFVQKSMTSSSAQRSPAESELPVFPESATRLKRAAPEDVRADIEASLSSALEELNMLELPQPAAPREASRAAPRAVAALPRQVPASLGLPRHMPPLPASEPRLIVAIRKPTPPPLPVPPLPVTELRPGSLPAVALGLALTYAAPPKHSSPRRFRGVTAATLGAVLFGTALWLCLDHAAFLSALNALRALHVR